MGRDGKFDPNLFERLDTSSDPEKDCCESTALAKMTQLTDGFAQH